MSSESIGWSLLVVLFLVGLIGFGVWHSRQVAKVGQVLEDEYHIVCPDDGGQCYPVKN